MHNTAQMGPFYEKYFKKMGQMYVKDRVKRIKQTLDCAKAGNLSRFKTSYMNMSANENTEQLLENSRQQDL